MNTLLIATRNPGKFIELQQILSALPFRLLSLQDFPEFASVEETGSTFEENAALKAAGYASRARVLTLADDSGLEVAALAGQPGVLSARYAGPNASDSERIEKLLAELAFTDEMERDARFVSAVAIADMHGAIVNLRVGICTGRIALAARGRGGFGYDPVFIPKGFDLSLAELDASIKNRISHRAHALKQAREYLLSLTHSLNAG